jgi:NADPH-dependent curcumin reductase CurA
LVQVLKKEFPRGADIIYESVGGDMFDLCLNALAVHGRLIVIGMISQVYLWHTPNLQLTISTLNGNFSGINRIWLVCSMFHPIQYFIDFETNEQLRSWFAKLINEVKKHPL